MRQNTIKLIGLFAAAALTVGTVAPTLAAEPAPTAVFTDLAGYGWAEDAISFLAEKQIVIGDGAGNFRPGETIKRADFVMILVNAFQLQIDTRDSFVDVKKGSYYYAYISTAKERGILHETRDNKFFPEEPLTRQDAMVLLYRALQVKRIPLSNSATLTGFSDVALIDRAAMAPIQALVGAGIVGGTDGALNPQGTLSRAEMSCILYRAMTELHEFWIQ